MNGAVAARGQTDAAFKSALRQFEAVDDRGPHLLRIGPTSRDQQFALIDDRLDLVEVDARQSDQHQHRAFGLEDVDWRLPGDRGARAGRLKELPMHALRARQHLEGLRPHPIAWKFCFHRLTRTRQRRFLIQSLSMLNSAIPARVHPALGARCPDRKMVFRASERLRNGIAAPFTDRRPGRLDASRTGRKPCRRRAGEMLHSSIEILTTPRRDDLDLLRIANGSGLSVSVLPSGAIFAIEHSAKRTAGS